MKSGSREKLKTKDQFPSDTATSTIKCSHFEFMETFPLQNQGKGPKNLKNSFYVQRFKKNSSNRPYSSQPYNNLRNSHSNTYHVRQNNNFEIIAPFFNLDSKPNVRQISKSLASYNAEQCKKRSTEGVFFEKQRNPDRVINEIQKSSGQNLNKKRPEMFGTNINDEMEKYWSLVNFKNYKRPEKKKSKVYEHSIQQTNSKLKLKQSQKCIMLNYQDNLSIRSLRPNPLRATRAIRRQALSFSNEPGVHINAYSTERFTTEQVSITNKDDRNGQALIKYRSNFQEKQSSIKKLRKTSALPIQSFKRTSLEGKSISPNSPGRKTVVLTQYFGKSKQSTVGEQLQRLKALYYRDLIWKIWFNSGWKTYIQSYSNGKCDFPRYFVGRGNNSKLIKAIMGKRFWWKLQSEQKSANFLWTQLKIYSAYHSQIQYQKISEFETEDSVKQDFLTEQLQKQDGSQNIEMSQFLRQMTTQPMKNLIRQQLKLYDEEWYNFRSVIPDKNVNILTYQKYKKWQAYIKNTNNLKRQSRSMENLQQRKLLQKQSKMTIYENYPQKSTNHIHYSRLIGNKKALYKTMSLYYELSKKTNKFIPQTFHITNGLQDQEYLKFLNQYYRKFKEQNNSMWIVKPGQMSNRGCGIEVCQDIQDIKKILKNKKVHVNGKPFTNIIQEYLRQPFLYQGRKFDIRHYMMITSSFGRIKGYWYHEGYIRTTSYKYSTKNNNSYVHLTNDAVQKNCKDYGKYQKGNKVSYEEFEKYLKGLPDRNGRSLSFYETIIPKIREITIDIMRACYFTIDPKRKGNNFEIFGLDIMIDADFRPWLIEVNTNPCLELSSPVLARVIPRMLDNAFTIALDPLFPPPLDVFISGKKNNLPENYITSNKFQLVFDQVVDGKYLNKIYEQNNQNQNTIQGFGSDEQAYESAEDDCDAQY